MHNFQQYFRHGFLPAQLPLQLLPSKFAPWEILLKRAQLAVATLKEKDALDSSMRRWRASIRKMDVIECHVSEGEEQVAQRAHHVLSFLTQYYVQSLPADPERQKSMNCIPAPLAVPLVAVSRKLGIAPIVTYADAVLWNWTLIDTEQPLSCDNVQMVDLFTGDKQEEHFFLTSLKMEISGQTSLRLMLENATNVADGKPPLSSTSEDLGLLAQNIRELTRIFCNLRHGLDPTFFYNSFRPWIQGADQGSDSPPWHYEGVNDGGGLLLQPSGPSAGQSALMHSLDVFLGVIHPHKEANHGQGCAHANAALDPHRKSRELHQTIFQHGGYCCTSLHAGPKPAEDADASPCIDASEKTSGGEVDTSFNARMRSYMPLEHREFLLWLEKNNIKNIASNLPESTAADTSSLFWQNLNSATDALREWRDSHIQIVTQYVIIPGRQKLAEGRVDRAKT